MTYYMDFPINTFGFLIDLTCLLVVSLPLSWLVFLYIEEPFGKLGDTLINKLKAPVHGDLEQNTPLLAS